MAFDKEAFRRKAQAKAIRERVQKVRASRVTENEAPASDSNLSKEEQRVLEQYRQWKKTGQTAKKTTPLEESKNKSAVLRKEIARRIRENAQVPADGPTGDPASAVDTSMPKEDKVGTGKTITQKQLEARKERIAKLRRKLEKRARIAKIKERIAEKRNQSNDPQSSIKVREEAQNLKKRIARVRKMIENDMMQQPQQPAGAQSQMMDPNAGMDPAAAAPAAQLPPEVVAEIQNIATAAQSLAALAGVPAANALGADADAGIGAEMGAGVEGMEQEMQQPVLEKKVNDDRKRKVLEAIKKRRAANGSADSIVESTRARVAERREALKKLRAQAMKEDYKAEGAEASTSQIKSEVDAYMGNNHNDPKQVVHQAGRKIDGPSPSMPGKASLKPAKVWPTKPAKSQKFESEEADIDPDQEVLTEEQVAEKRAALAEQGWDEKHIDAYISRKELNFREMISRGLLG
jgi:hypothetical protein